MNYSSHSKQNTPLNKLGFGLLVIVILLYYFIIQRLTINIPFGDEFACALMWLDRYFHLDTIQEKFLQLFSQANEHRLFTFSLAVLTDHSLFGSLNFKRLGWEANLGMILLLWVVNLLNTTDRRNPWILLPVALLFFVPQHEITNWPVVGFAAIIQYVLIVGSLWMLSRPGWITLTGAMLLASMATFSFGNGMLVFVAGFLVLALKNPGSPIKWIIWTLAMTVSIFLYFQDYHFSDQSGLLASAFRTPLPIIQFFLTFFGNILHPYNNINLMWITLAGLLPLSALAYLILFKWREVKNHPVALSVLFFVILSACMAAISRQSFGAIGATAPRYVLLQALFLAVLYLLFINIFASRAKYFLMFVICGSLLLYGARLVKGVYSMNHHKEQLKRMIVVYHLNLPEKVIFNPGPDRIKKILDRSAKLGFYAPPALKDDVKRAEPFRPSNLKDMPESLRFNIDLFKPAVDTLQIIGWAFSLLDRKQEQSIGILLQSDSDSLVIPAMMYERKDVVQHFKNQIPDIQPQCGFSLYMDLSSMKLQPGEFRIGICLFKDRKLLGWIKTDKSIKIENTTTEP